jgi:hypothetical protein
MRNPYLEIHLFARVVRDEGGPTRWDPHPIVVEKDRLVYVAEDARLCDRSGACIGVQVIPAPTARLALWSPRGRRVLVNGQPAPSLAIARAGDEIALDGADHFWRLHVSIYRPKSIGVAGEDLIGRECPLCLGRFSAENAVFRCGCGSALHVAERAAESELDCARAVANCPDCRRTIVLESGYEELPRDDTGREILPEHRNTDVAAV